MANTIIELRRSNVSGNVPSNLANGEIAINTYDGKLFYRGGVSNTIQTIERYTGPAGLNGEIQFNDSGVLGSDSDLTYNKTTDTFTTKNVSANSVSIRTNGIVPIELFSDNTVSSFQYTGKSFSVSGQETVSTGIHFKPDGTKMFIIGSSGDDINEYALSTAWEITTATFTRVTAALTDTAPSALRFSSDGLSAYVLGDTNDRIYQHTLTEAWNVATLNTTATNTFTVTSQESSPTGLAFNPTGTKMFVVGSSGDDINEYDLSTAGNVATATFVQTGSLASPSGSTADTAPGSVDFSADGTRLFVSGTTGEEINEYALSTPFNVSTISWVSYRYTGFESADPTGIFLALPNNFFYIVSSSGDAVYQYTTNANSLIANTHNLNVSGNVLIDYNQTVMGGQFVQGSHTVSGTSTLSTTSVSGTLTGSSTLSLTGATNSTTLVGTSATTGDMRIGGSTQTGEITIGFSTQNQTLNIANGATTSTNTKTVYIGAAGLSGSQTNVIIGSTLSGSRGNTNIYTPNVLITAANTAQTSIRILGGQASISNSTGTIIVNGGVGVNGSIYADAIYDGGVEIIGFSNAAFNTANAAFLAANAATATDTTQNNSIAAAFTAANSAGVYANGAFVAANTADVKATSAGIYANGAFAAANAATATDLTQNNSITAAFTAANSAGVYANGAFAKANTQDTINLTQNNSITSAFAAANAATATDTTQNNSITAAFNTANAAFTRANNSLNANTGGSITGDISITGNLTVTGNTTYTNTITVLIGDNIIVLNADLSPSAQPTENAGIEIDRGAQPNSSFLWIETSGKWAANNGNTEIFLASEATLTSSFNTANAAFLAANAATATDTTQNNSITSAFTAANSAGVYANGAFAAANAATATDTTQNNSIAAAFTAANSSGVYANGAFTQANSNYTSAVTKLDVTNSGSSAFLIDQYTGNNPSIYVSGGETIAFNLNVSGHPFVIRESSGGANTSTGLTHVSTTGVVSTGASAQGYVTGVLYWKVPFSLVGSTYVYQCTIHGGMVGNIVIQQPASFVAANTTLAFNTANAAFLAANAATATDTTQNNSITAAFAAANSASVYANGAFAKANTQDDINLTQNNSITAAFAAANAATATDTTQNNSIAAAFTRANNSINANTGGTITGNVIISANLTASNVATQTYIQFGDGSRQFTANAGSGGGTTDTFARNQANSAFIQANAAFNVANTGGGVANSFGQIVANVGTILATSSNDSLQIVGESGISVSSNVSAKKVIVSVPAGFTFTTADYGFVIDSTNVIYDYGTI